MERRSAARSHRLCFTHANTCDAPPHVHTSVTYIYVNRSPALSGALVLSYLNRRLREAMATPIHINFVRIVLIVPICKLLTVPKRRRSRLAMRGRLPPVLGIKRV